MKTIESIGVIWARFGPYHVARLRGAADFFRPDGVAVHGIETARRDSIYKWCLTDSDDSFYKHTVFEANYGDLTSREIGKGIRKMLDVINPDAVAINGWAMPEARAALRWCRDRNRIAVLMSESMEKDTRRRWGKELIKTLIVRHFDAALVGGRPHAEYAARLGMPCERIFLGYDAVDNDYFLAGSDRARRDAVRLRQQYGLPDRYFYANTRFLPRKNVDGLLHAYAVYCQKAENPWNLVITGDGEELPRLLTLCKDLPLTTVIPTAFEGVKRFANSPPHSPTVFWPGFVQYSDLPVFYGLASAFIHPAKSEPWGLVINEAAAAGLPLLVSRTVGSQFELVRDEGNGYAFDPFNIAAMTQVLLRTSELTNEERVRMGQRSRAIVSDYGPERFARGLKAAIEASLNGTMPSAPKRN